MLKKIRKEGISVLYVGNHHQELFKIADRTALFSDGHIYKVFERDEMTDERWHRTSQNGRSCPRRMIRMPRMTDPALSHRGSRKFKWSSLHPAPR